MEIASIVLGILELRKDFVELIIGCLVLYFEHDFLDLDVGRF